MFNPSPQKSIRGFVVTIFFDLAHLLHKMEQLTSRLLINTMQCGKRCAMDLYSVCPSVDVAILLARTGASCKHRCIAEMSNTCTYLCMSECVSVCGSALARVRARENERVQSERESEGDIDT